MDLGLMHFWWVRRPDNVCILHLLFLWNSTPSPSLRGLSPICLPKCLQTPKGPDDSLVAWIARGTQNDDPTFKNLWILLPHHPYCAINHLSVKQQAPKQSSMLPLPNVWLRHYHQACKSLRVNCHGGAGWNSYSPNTYLNCQIFTPYTFISQKMCMKYCDNMLCNV